MLSYNNLLKIVLTTHSLATRSASGETAQELLIMKLETLKKEHTEFDLNNFILYNSNKIDESLFKINITVKVPDSDYE